MNHCSIAYTFYETDYRVRRYAEAVAGPGNIDEYYFDDSMITFFEPENAEDMARCIIELHKNPEKGRSLAQNAKQFVAQNNWQVKKQIYLDLVDSLVSSKGTEQTRAKTF